MITPPNGKKILEKQYDGVVYEKGAEMGRFNMGSTVIMLFENPLVWEQACAAGGAVRLGEKLAELQAEN